MASEAEEAKETNKTKIAYCVIKLRNERDIKGEETWRLAFSMFLLVKTITNNIRRENEEDTYYDIINSSFITLQKSNCHNFKLKNNARHI